MKQWQGLLRDGSQVRLTPWARTLVSDDELAVIRQEAIEREAHVNLNAVSPRGPLHATVWATGPDRTAVEWLRTQGPVEYVVSRVHEALALPPEMGICHECGEQGRQGYLICSGCCSHEHVETTDEADGHEGGLPHEWRSTCQDCGAEVEYDGEAWEVVS